MVAAEKTRHWPTGTESATFRPPTAPMKLIRRLNQPLPPDGSARGHELLSRGLRADDEWLVVLAFSGGGTRAAALAYGVLEELARTTLRKGGRPRRLIDEVDTLSAVSGGSFTAAYFALHGDRIFDDFEKVFLKRDIQGALMRQIARPQHWLPLVSKRLGRSDLAADYYDYELFGCALYGDLLHRKNRPDLIINATDMVTGVPFAFTQRNFDLIGSDLTQLPLARAVAASSAAPLVLSPLTLRNFAAPEAAEAHVACLQEVQRTVPPGGSTDRLAQALVSYLDAEDRPFIHLVDGGVADNLGLRGLLDMSAMNGGFSEMLKLCRFNRVRKIAVIVVNAAAKHGARWNHGSNPGVVDVLQAVSEHATHQASARTIAEFKAGLEDWRTRPEPETAEAAAIPRAYHLVEVSFDRLSDPAERRFFRELPTSLTLPAVTVDRLREVGGRLLRESRAFQQLLQDFDTPAPVGDASPVVLESNGAGDQAVVSS